MKLKTAPVTNSQPPHNSTLARSRSVRAARHVNTSPTNRPMSAAGSSHDASAPNDGPNIRVMPGSPPKNRLAPPRSPPPGPWPPPGEPPPPVMRWIPL
jgi:hypothetical protein